jgi:hypothetical protein
MDSLMGQLADLTAENESLRERVEHLEAQVRMLESMYVCTHLDESECNDECRKYWKKTCNLIDTAINKVVKHKA